MTTLSTDAARGAVAAPPHARATPGLAPWALGLALAGGLSLPLWPGASRAADATATNSDTPAAATRCTPAPLGSRELFLRGTLNGWTADDTQRFVWQCSRYELVTRVNGEHEFKVADADWSADADWGQAPQGQPLKTGVPQPLHATGGGLRYRFTGAQKFVLTPNPAPNPPTMTVSDCPAAPAPDTPPLYLRGTMNNWGAMDDYAFQWHCDAWYLNVNLPSRQEFKIGDARWDNAHTFGATSASALATGETVGLLRATEHPVTANLLFNFSGEHTLRLSFDGPGGAGRLSIGPKTFADPHAKSITDPVALSLRHDSRQAGYKAPFGAQPAPATFSFALDALPGVQKASLVIEKRQLEGNQELLKYTELQRLPLSKAPHGDHERWSTQATLRDVSVYGYWFEVEIGGQTYVYGNNTEAVAWTREKGSNGLGSVVEKPAATERIRRFRQTVYAADFKVPAYAPDLVYYYIFPERFRNGNPANDPRPGVTRYQNHTVELHKTWTERPFRPGTGDGSDELYNNDFFGGDIEGIIQKLDYIRSVGANALYITPMFQAASNHKYDTADYKKIDPHFGSNADFARLCAEAAKRGIKVIPDTSLNHVGSDSIYFDRFGNHAAAGHHGAFANGRIDTASPYAKWFSFDASQKEADKQYKGWVGVLDLPEIDKNDPGFRQFAYGAPDSVMKYWLDQGAAGWRMDVAPWVPDSFWREWRAAIKQHRPDAITISETWFDASKYFLGDMFDSTMNYIFRNAVLDFANGGDAALLYRNLELTREAYPPQSFHALMNLISSHDQARALHVFGDVDGQASPAQTARAKQRLRLATLFQMSFPGSPAIYYGDEVGVTGGDDPMNRATYPWADQGGHPDEALLADFRMMTRLRAEHAVLRRGSLLAPVYSDAHVIVMARQLGSTWALVALNNDEQAHQVTVTLPEGAPLSGWRAALGAAPQALQGRTLALSVPATFGTVLVTP